jgi:glutathione synthase/RimK-type ligase-like ATP-grasp enzyme
MHKIAFLTMDSLQDFVAYDHLVVDRLNRSGIQVEEISWRCPAARWDDYRLVVIRSPWDYQSAPAQFLNVLETIEQSSATLLNSLDIVRWNIRKLYLQTLEQSGTTIVPTLWLNSPQEPDLRVVFEQLNVGEIVVKPVIGANADNAFRLTPASLPETFRQAAMAFYGSIALAQPFIRSVVERGEYSLIFFEGQFSQGVVKKPKTGDFRVQEEHGATIAPCSPPQDLVEFARNSHAAVPGSTL